MSRSRWSVVALLFAALAVGCGEGAAGSLGAGGTAGDGGTASMGGSGATGTGVTTTTSITGVTASSSSGGGMGGMGGGADCVEGGLYALSDTGLDENEVSMCKYRGDVLLIVNIAEA